MVKFGAIGALFTLAVSSDDEVKCEATRGLAVLYYGLEESSVRNITTDQVQILFNLAQEADPATQCQVISQKMLLTS